MTELSRPRAGTESGQAVDAEPTSSGLNIPVQFPLALPELVRPQAASGSLATERRDAVTKIGKPYQVAGRWYTPSHQPDYSASGQSSWYGPEFHGKRTANGEIYNKNRLTAAHPTLPLPCYVSVTNKENGRTIVVRVNDRGPYARGRIIDVSQRAAELLGFVGKGMATVQVRYVGAAPIGPDDSFEQKFLAQQPWAGGGPRLAVIPKTGWDADLAVAQ